MVNLLGSTTTSGTSRLDALANLAWNRCSGERRASCAPGFLLLEKTPLLSVRLLVKTASLSPRLWLRRSLRHLLMGLSTASGEVEREDGRGVDARRPRTWRVGRRRRASITSSLWDKMYSFNPTGCSAPWSVWTPTSAITWDFATPCTTRDSGHLVPLMVKVFFG